MATGLTVLITFAIDYLITLKLFEVDFIKESMQFMRTSYEQSLKLTQGITGQTALTKENLELIFVTMETYNPSFSYFSGICISIHYYLD